MADLLPRRPADIVAPVSETRSDFERIAAEAEKYLGSDPNSAIATTARSRIAHSLSRAVTADQLHAKAKNYFDEYPLARAIKDDVIPALYTAGEEERTLQHALKKLSHYGLPKTLFAQIEAEWEDETEFMDRELSNHERMVLAQRVITYHMIDHHILLVTILNRQGLPAFGIARIIDAGEHGPKDDLVRFYSVNVLHPILIPPMHYGMSDKNIGVAWADRIACRLSAQEICDMRTGKLPVEPWMDPVVRCSWRYDGAGSLAEAHHGLTLCEEIKHELNFRRRLKEDPPSGPDHIPNKFIENRLRREGSLHRLWLNCHTDDERVALRRSIEEVNAKLVVTTFGPDPELSIAHLQGHLLQAQKRMAGVPTDYELLGELLSLRQMPVDTAQRPRERDRANERRLRLRSFELLQKEFSENWSDTPFCILNQNGCLQPHEKTHPMFAQWAALS
jgi:hypothetical protein